jgi:hypothetical protein
MKNNLDSEAVRMTMSAWVFDGSSRGISKKMALYQGHILHGSFAAMSRMARYLGVCGIEVHADYVEILRIVIVEHTRHCALVD